MSSLHTSITRSGRALAFVALLSAAAFAAPPAAPSGPLPRPLTLDGALVYAAEHNPTLRRVREQIREQEGIVLQAGARRIPNVEAAGSYGRVDDELVAAPGYDNESWSFQVTANQVLYAGGSLRAGTRAAREQAEAARLAFQAQLHNTLLATRQAFASVLLDRELIAVQEEAIAVLEAELANARARREAGTGSDFDVIRAEVAVANAQPPLIQARNAYRIAQDQLRQQLGAPASVEDAPTDLGVEGTLSDRGDMVSLGAALDTAHARRPELRRQLRLVTAADHNVTVAKSGRLPTVSAYAGYEWANAPASARLADRRDGWMAGINSNWAIFDGRATAGKVRQARSQATQTRLAQEELALAIDVEVRQAHSALTEANELVAASTKTVEQAQESLRLARARQQAGTATQLDVLSAQSALTLARSTQSQARYAFTVALAGLQRAIGSTP